MKMNLDAYRYPMTPIDYHQKHSSRIVSMPINFTEHNEIAYCEGELSDLSVVAVDSFLLSVENNC